MIREKIGADHSGEYIDSKNTIQDVIPIEESRNAYIKNRSQIHEMVEAPLVIACEELYDKNIRTLSTSANIKDIKTGFGHIIIDYDSLSQENRLIGQKLGEVFFADGINQLLIKIPLKKGDSPKQISAFTESIVHNFQKQSMSWAPSFTLEQVRRIYGIDPNNEEFGVETFTDSFFYDSDRKLFFLSEEHAEKSKNS